MSTPKRELLPDEVYHVYNRGADKKKIFNAEDDCSRFLNKVIEYKKKFPLKILAYCLMPNHFHFSIRVGLQPEGLATTPRVEEFFHRLFTSYGKYYDCRYEDHSGRVFQGTYKTKHVKNDSYYLKLCAYIHDNPVRKELVEKPEEWPFSSYRALIKGRADGIVDPQDHDHLRAYVEFIKKREDSLNEIVKHI